MVRWTRVQLTSAILLTCALLGALLLVVLGRGASRPAAHGGDGTSPGLGQAGFDLLTRSGSYPAYDYLLDRAERKLIQQCMAAAGFQYLTGQASPPRLGDEEREVDMAGRREHGYGLFDQYGTSGHPTGELQTTAGPALSAPEQAAYLHALRGGSSDMRSIHLAGGGDIVVSGAGCEATSRQRLYHSLVEWAQIRYVPQRLNLSITPRVQADTALAAAMHQWAGCMAAQGYPYLSPGNATDRLRAEYQRAGPTPAMHRREIDVAVADGRCGLRLHIPSTVLSIRRHYADLLPAATRTELEQLAVLWLASARTARPFVDPA